MVTDQDMDDVFQAMAHTSRRRMMDLIHAGPGLAVGELAAHFDVSRIAVMNHLAVLERAGLVISRKDGARRRLYLNAVPLQDIHDRWTSAFTAEGARLLQDIRTRAEGTARQKEKDHDG